MNKKGYTTIELLICFIIISAISAGMFAIVLNYREKQQVESIRSDVITYKNSTTKMIQDDIIKNEITDVSLTNGKLIFTFKDGETASLTVDNNQIKYSSKQATETMIAFPLPEIPNLKIEQGTYFIIDEENHFATINIPFTHPDLDDKDYGIFVAFPFRVPIDDTLPPDIVFPVYEMGITNVKLLSTENGGYEVANSQFLPNQTIMSVGLPNLNSRVTYQVTMKNTSDAYYNLKSMLEVSTTNANIKYAISEMAVGNILKANSTKTFKVIFFYTTSTLPSSTEGMVTINYEYAKNQEYDLSGSGNHGTITNVAYNNDGTITTDGSTSSFINAGLVNYDFGSKVTFGVRVKLHEIKTENSYLLANTENAGISLYVRPDGEIRAGIYVAGVGSLYAYSKVIAEVDTWYTIVATYDGTDLKIYVNGALKATGTSAGTIGVSTAPITISGNPNANGVITTPANATFDNAFIFKRVLSATEIQNGYRGIINMYNKSNLLMYYEFSENKVADLSGNNGAAIVHNAILNNDGTFTTKDVDDSYVDMGLAQYNFGKEATLALRLKIHSLDEVVEFFGANVQGGGMALRSKANGSLDAQFYINGAYVYADSGITPTLNTWYTLVATYDGTNLKLYINGTLAKTMPATGNIGVSLMPFVLGGQPDAGVVKETIEANYDSVLIFDRALTASEVSSNYSGVINPLNKNNLLRYYEF